MLSVAKRLRLVVLTVGVGVNEGSSVACFDGLGRILSKVEEVGVWPEGLLDAKIVKIQNADGDAIPLGQRPLSVPVVYRICASVQMVPLEDWLRSWGPGSVFSAGVGVRSWQQLWTLKKFCLVCY